MDLLWRHLPAFDNRGRFRRQGRAAVRRHKITAPHSAMRELLLCIIAGFAACGAVALRPAAIAGNK